ncbi:hypothetical protein E1A91_D08G067600v1 [Gossypium mustelinum]|uniref:Nuclear transcription factor Y subunit n=1 Tax=Gossypium mustelinum TaxID=34275 RepID=A0A5D2TU42_GOSMU|nr:hypothetical protein E1A91_D08G067600v1 [Gossypium mustelinum]TYI68124.1 hypothetical protein E1A91_D08G067600v1 [Gossypium mustelinum]TYI68125.1 hypothetical protein E1A91_D08G067600v1 [Gossypium mustelinum]TYI68126.1 hypothetical protein E1A91_D08G067600v1 [Gossypium mustelinum]
MPAKPRNEDQRMHHGAQSALNSTAYSEPWWKAVGIDLLDEAASKSPSAEKKNGPTADGDGRNGHDEQYLKHVPSAAPLTLVEHLEPNSQMELAGHSIVLKSYPCSDSQYSGILALYGPQIMVSPLYGMHHARMPLPLQMEEEPVYVNAKQYHGILRRRQIRAKAELEKKVIKVRKPYLHESRHLHAMRRARGSGGRFLNKKKLDDHITSPNSEKGMNSDENISAKSAHLSGFECLSSSGTGNLSSFYGQQEGNVSLVKDLHKAQPLANSTLHLSSNNAEKGNYFRQQRDIVQRNGAQHGAPSIK